MVKFRSKHLVTFIQRYRASMWKLLLNRHLANIYMWPVLSQAHSGIHTHTHTVRNCFEKKKLKKGVNFVCMQIDCSCFVCFSLSFNEKKMQNSFLRNAHEVNKWRNFWLCLTWVFVYFCSRLQRNKKYSRSKLNVDYLNFKVDLYLHWYQKQTLSLFFSLFLSFTSG